MDRHAQSADEYFVTALQIFEYCGAESDGALRVDALMNKFAPFVKTNKTEYSYLKSLLDPEQSDPEINVTKLANALSKYSESQKSKVDLDESFNLHNGQVPQDSDSGISTDGCQLVEELQCELKEKVHLAHQLRSQLDFTDRQHEEALAALTAERDSLRSHLNMLREENMTLTHVRSDYEDACDRLCASELALGEARRDLDYCKKRAKTLHEQLSTLEAEKLTLQELLTKSKDECHRINEMYASRQSALLEENETLKTEHADLSVRLQDQDEFLQQMIKEKVLLEMELKDVLNKSNSTQFRLERSIDVSFPDDQMLSALDSLTANSQFAHENQLLDEDEFLNALKEDEGRATNMSLFDEIRFSMSNISIKHSISEPHDCESQKSAENVFTTSTGVQTDEDCNDIDCSTNNNGQQCRDCFKYRELQHELKNNMSFISIGIQTENEALAVLKIHCEKFTLSNAMQTENMAYCELKTQRDKYTVSTDTQTEVMAYCDLRIHKDKHTVSTSVQTEKMAYSDLKIRRVNNTISTGTQTEKETNVNGLEINNNSVCDDNPNCFECENLKIHAAKLESELKHSCLSTNEVLQDLEKYEDNLAKLHRMIRVWCDRNNVLQATVGKLQEKLTALESVNNSYSEILDGLTRKSCSAECQTGSDQTSVSTQVEVPCADCVNRNAAVPHRRLRKFLWEPLKCLFQVFAVVCFFCAVSLLYGVSRRRHARCDRAAPAVPWRWLSAQDLMDLLLSIEYVADVPK